MTASECMEASANVGLTVDRTQGCRFHVGTNRLELPVVILTGTCRSGKTLLAQLAGSMTGVEWIEEPWVPMMLPVLQGTGMIAAEVASDMMRAVTEELVFDRILLRGANFRPGDLSSIWSVKDPVEIFDRLTNLRSRDDVRAFVQERRPTLLYVLAETNPFIPFLLAAFPRGHVIHVVRNGLDVARGTMEKGWFSRERFLNPTDNVLYRPYRTTGEALHYLPWWVKVGEEERFLSLGPFGMGLYYWCSLMRDSLPGIAFARRECAARYTQIRYEDLVQDPAAAVARLGEVVRTGATERTAILQGRVHRGEVEHSNDTPLAELPEAELASAREVLEVFGYGA
jgi:hypothetical protein